MGGEGFGSGAAFFSEGDNLAIHPSNDQEKTKLEKHIVAQRKRQSGDMLRNDININIHEDKHG